jgi:TolB-like protein/DNA-binding winged helix-turn-helix (wHTH) protein/tetratricopeptide (TPR) repeat protein
LGAQSWRAPFRTKLESAGKLFIPRRIKAQLRNCVLCDTLRFPPIFMPAVTQAPEVRRFGVFEIDLRSGELRKHGMRLRLSGQPFQVLAVLIEHAGEVVTREELHSKLWLADTFVDFDHGLNNAVARIREVLDDSSESPRYVETVPRRGYRFIAPLAELRPAIVPPSAQELPVNPADQATPPKDSEPARIAAKKEFSAGLKILFGTAAVLLLVAVTGVLYRSPRGRGTTQAGIKSLAVLPLKNLSGDPKQEYLADGMTEEIIGRLAAIHDLRVISRTSVMRFKDTQLSEPEIARSLGADAIVEGSVMRDGSHIRVHAQLIRGSTDEHFWSATYDRELPDVLSLQSDVAQAIATKVEVTVTGKEHERLAAARSVSPEVYESYLKGRYVFDTKGSSRAGVEESIGYFADAITRDPTFAPAYVSLADAYGWLGSVTIGGGSPREVRPKIMGATQKALELDPDLAEAHVALAGMLLDQWHWAEAEAEYRRALELQPSNAAAYGGLADWLMLQGRFEEAVASARRARQLAPSEVSGRDFGWILFNARRYDEAIREYRSALAVEPDNAYSLWRFGFALSLNGQVQEAIPIVERAVAVSHRAPGNIGVLAVIYSRAGRRRDALQLLAELKKRREAGYVPAGAFVLAYMGLADYEQAFTWLEEAYKEQSYILLLVKVHPVFDPVRNDPRFVDLVRRVGLQ